MAIPSVLTFGVAGLPEVKPGDSLGELIVGAVRRNNIRVVERDVFVVTQKVVSKAEGRMVGLGSVEPSARAREFAAELKKDPRLLEVILRESKRVVRKAQGVLIVETRHGYVCANGGVDTSNAPDGVVTLLPEDPDESALQLQVHLQREFGVRLAVVLSDTFGRPWREGVVNVAVGVAGLAPLLDYRGRLDTYGRKLQVTVVAVADELAAAAELVMRKTESVPVAIVRGYDYEEAAGWGRDLVRPAERDLFR